jgi:SAM-dependent methyltransferase
MQSERLIVIQLAPLHWLSGTFWTNSVAVWVRTSYKDLDWLGICAAERTGNEIKILNDAKLVAQNCMFKLWQWRNPGSSFKDYFADLVKKDLAQGRRHPSLGRILWEERFHNFQARMGIRPDDVCVDYGCGTLRMGIHVIRFLNRGCYWGLDIDQDLLDRGCRTLGPQLEDKAPNLRVISPATVREAASSRPALLFSIRVLIHVHPDELGEYMGNILTIVRDGGRAVITGKWSPAQTFQFGRQSWAHSLEELNRVATANGGQIRVLAEKDWPFIKIGKVARGGALEIRGVSQSIDGARVR